MSCQKLRGFTFISLCVFISLLAACHRASYVKRTSTDPVKQAHLNWSYQTTVDAYQKAGFTGRKWNAAAERALAEFACSRAQVLKADEPWAEIVSTNAAAAVRAGCKDPLVNYLYIKFSMDQTNSKEAYVEAFAAMARTMNQSSYPPIRKFYAAARTLDQIYFTYHTNSASQPVTSEIWAMLPQQLNAALADKTMPAREAYEAADVALPLVRGDKNYYMQMYHDIETALFANWPNDYHPWLMKGIAHIEMAWLARGSGYAGTVNDEGWKLFGEHLATAEDAFEHAWKINPDDPNIAIRMIKVKLGQGGGREQMELWFKRAMELDHNSYDACSGKLFYLEPKWHGSVDAMLKFGRECAHHYLWEGHVPLILLDAHKSIQAQYIDAAEKADYWKRPEVWADLKLAFNRFFELNPNETSWYHNYVWFAYHAEQWDALNELIPKLGPVNYAYFGGEDEFNKMVQLAQAHAAKPK